MLDSRLGEWEYDRVNGLHQRYVRAPGSRVVSYRIRVWSEGGGNVFWAVCRVGRGGHLSGHHSGAASGMTVKAAKAVGLACATTLAVQEYR